MEEEEEEVVDPKPAIENSCKPRCVKQLLTYEVIGLNFIYLFHVLRRSNFTYFQGSPKYFLQV